MAPPRRTSPTAPRVAKGPRTSPRSGNRTPTATPSSRRAPRAVRRRTHVGGASSPATAVVITGGGSGIGLASALAVAEVGRAVAIWDRDGTAARAAARRCTDEFGVRASGLKVDVTQSKSLKAAIKKSRSELGTIGGLVHAAGIWARFPSP